MGGEVRALSFTRHLGGGDDVDQRAVFRAACAARGWLDGGAVRQNGAGTRALVMAVRLVRCGGRDLVVVDRLDRLAATEAGVLAALVLFRRERVRLLAALDDIDTGSLIGAALVDSLLPARA